MGLCVFLLVLLVWGLVYCIQSLYGSKKKCETSNEISTGSLIVPEQQVGSEDPIPVSNFAIPFPSDGAKVCGT